MAASAILKVDIITDAKKALAGLDSIGNEAEKTGSRFGTFGKVAGGALLGVGAAAVGAAAGAVAFGVSAVKAAQESEVATKRLDAVFSAMGDTTGDASRAAQDYASALSRKIAVDDEIIMAGQAQLATFAAVSNETARAAGVFDRATAAAADLAAAGFGSMDTNAVQLGKALNDPIKGLAALTKSGVTFTDAQKEQIKVLQESGDLLGAQNIVLAAVEGQVKGTAEATATGADKMGIAFGEFQESVGAALLPIINGLMPLFTAAVDFLTVEVGGGIKAMVAAFTDGGDDITSSGIAGIFERIGVAARNALPTIIDIFNNVKTAVVAVVPVVVEFGRQVVAAVVAILPHIIKFGKSVIEKVIPAVIKIAKAVKEALPPLIELAQDVLKFLAEQVLPKVSAALRVVVPIVAMLAEKIILLVGWLAQNRDVLLVILAPLLAYGAYTLALAAYQAVVTAATTAWTVAQGILNAVMSANPILIVVIAIAALVAAVILAYNRVDWFKNFVDTAFDAIVAAFNMLKDAAKKVFDWVSDNWPLLLAILTGPIGIAVMLVVSHFDTVKNAVLTVYNWIKDNWQLLLAILTGPFGLAVLAITTVWDPLLTFFKELPGKISTAFQFLASIIKAPFSAAFNAIAGFWNDTVGKLSFSIPSWVPGIGGNSFNVPDIPTLATGGTVARTGLAVVHAGEQFSGVGRTFSSGGNVTINVTTTGLGADAPQIQRAVANALRGYTARNGPLDIPVRGVA